MEFTCPNSEIDSSVKVICNYPNSSEITFNTPSGGTAARCTPDCSGGPRFSATYVNETQSLLTIQRVQWRDEGQWICQYGFGEDKDTCHLKLYSK